MRNKRQVFEKEIQSIAVVVGTRPGIIKMSPIIKTLEERRISHFVIHTGQHYSPEMDSVFINNLEIKSEICRVQETYTKIFHGEKTAHMIAGVEDILIKKKPCAVLVCGDADTNLAAGLAARKLHILLGHVESGLRSFDWEMPEEHNRVILDHISELLFAPTEECVINLKRESVRGEIHLTGNTIVEALLHSLKVARKRSVVIKELNLENNSYGILTTHREENVDNQKRLEGILKGIELILADIAFTIVFPIHPRTIKRMKEFGMIYKLKQLSKRGLLVVDPLDYFDFLSLMSSSQIIMTDSGGIQEEACIMNIPTVTLRNNTERPETLKNGNNRLAGTNPSSILNQVRIALSTSIDPRNHPFGDGQAASRIVDLTINSLKSGITLNNSKMSEK